MSEGRGTCFGFEVQSTLPFSYLREGAGEPLQVVEPSEPVSRVGDPPLLEWPRTERRPFVARLYRRDELYEVWFENAGWFAIEPGDRRIAVPEGDDVARREERLWGIPALLCFLHRGDLPLHAAAVEVDGRAILLAAPGTFGKTTLAAAFFSAGHRLLSEDLACLRLQEGPAIVPGPAMLRVRADVAAQLDVAGEVVSTAGERTHVALPSPRGDCRPVPLQAIVLLLPSTDELTLTRVAARDAVRDLWALSFRLPTEADSARTFSALADLTGQVPVWSMSRPLSLEALSPTVERIVAEV